MAASVVIGAAVWFYFLTQSSKAQAYVPTILIGIGMSATFVVALAFLTELIGDNKVIVRCSLNISLICFLFWSCTANLTDTNITGNIEAPCLVQNISYLFIQFLFCFCFYISFISLELRMKRRENGWNFFDMHLHSACVNNARHCI